jgi:hypothetical protein
MRRGGRADDTAMRREALDELMARVKQTSTLEGRARVLWQWHNEHPPTPAEAREIAKRVNALNREDAAQRDRLHREYTDTLARLDVATTTVDHRAAAVLAERAGELHHELRRPERELLAELAARAREDALRPYRRGGTPGRIKTTLTALEVVISEIITAEPSASGLAVWEALRRRAGHRDVVLLVGRLPRRRGQSLKWCDSAGSIRVASQSYVVNKLLPRLRRRLGVPLRRRRGRLTS